MTNKILRLTIILMAVIMASCSNDDDNNAVPVNEEEIITTLKVTLTPIGGGTAVTLQSRDLDGDGPNAPVITVTGGDLVAGTTYNGVITLLNETENPPENITTEVEEEAEEHQFFFIPSAGLDAIFTYSNFDSNGNPLGTQFKLEAVSASTGSVNFVLRHEPNKPNDGTLANAGGETDISVTFDVTIQ